MGSQIQAGLFPRVEVVLNRDGAAAGARSSPVRDVLGKGLGAGDGRLVDLGVLPDVIGGSIALQGPDLGALCRALVVRRVLLDIVLDERVPCPAVDGHEHGAASARGGAVEGDVPKKKSREC